MQDAYAPRKDILGRGVEYLVYAFSDYTSTPDRDGLFASGSDYSPGKR
jgi:hypothetical protein